MRTVAIVQARRGSTRLPGKVLEDLEGRPMLARELDRLRAARRLDDVVVATTRAPEDDAVARLADRAGVRWFRGSGDDVLARYRQAAREARADVVVRVCGDCPLIDPGVVDRVVEAFAGATGEHVYASNVAPRTFPRGLDVEVVARGTLDRLAELADSVRAREHVTLLARERPDLFPTAPVTDDEDNSDLRWTVDVPADLAMVRRLYRELGLAEAPLPYRRVLAWVRRHPQVAAMNSEVPQEAP